MFYGTIRIENTRVCIWTFGMRTCERFCVSRKARTRPPTTSHRAQKEQLIRKIFMWRRYAHTTTTTTDHRVEPRTITNSDIQTTRVRVRPSVRSPFARSCELRWRVRACLCALSARCWRGTFFWVGSVIIIL